MESLGSIVSTRNMYLKVDSREVKDVGMGLGAQNDKGFVWKPCPIKIYWKNNIGWCNLHVIFFVTRKAFLVLVFSIMRPLLGMIQRGQIHS